MAEAVGDQASTEPVFVGQQLVLEVAIDAEDRAQRPVAIDRLEVLLVGSQVVVDQPRLTAVDGVRGPAAAGVHDDRGPGRRRAEPLQETRRADVARLDALHDGVALQADAQLATHERATTVAADQERRRDGHGLTRVAVPGAGLDPLGGLGHRLHHHSVQDPHPRLGFGMSEQHRLHVHLVDAVWRFGSRPPGVGSIRGRVAVPAARDRDAAEFDTDERRSEGDIVGVVGREPGVAQSRRHSETSEDLHRPGRDVIALHARRLGRVPLLDHDDVDASRAEVHRQRQPDRTPSDHHHRGFQALHGSVTCLAGASYCPVPASIRA